MYSHPAAANSPAAHLPTDDKRRGDHLKSDPLELYQRPTTGRNTKLGRKVEKPADSRAGGPSGQKGGGKQEVKHANK